MFTAAAALFATMTIASPVEEFLGPDALAVLEAPMAATVYRLQPTAPGATTNRQGIERFSDRREISLDAAMTLAGLLTSDKTYRFDRRRECDFEPSHAVRFEGLSHTVDVLFSFACKQARIVLLDRDERVLVRKTEEIDGARRALKRLVRRGLKSGGPAAVARSGRLR